MVKCCFRRHWHQACTAGNVAPNRAATISSLIARYSASLECGGNPPDYVLALNTGRPGAWCSSGTRRTLKQADPP